MDERSIADLAENDQVPVEDPASSSAGGIRPTEPEEPSVWNRLLTAETGPGPISAYRDHAINFTGDDGGARLARGMTGLFDNLNLAIVDLVVGGLQLAIGWRKKQIAAQAGGIPHAGS